MIAGKMRLYPQSVLAKVFFFPFNRLPPLPAQKELETPNVKDEPRSLAERKGFERSCMSEKGTEL